MTEPRREDGRAPGWLGGAQGSLMTSLKVWAFILSLCLVAVAVGIQFFVFDPLLGRALSAVATVLLLLVGVSGFSWEVWRLLERVEVRLRAAYAGERAQRRQLEALGAANADLITGIEMDELAQKIVDRSREVTGARYGALAILGSDGMISGFYTSGLDSATRARMGPPPTGHGLLGLVIEQGHPLRVDDVTAHPAAAGFPPHHPQMRALLAVPVWMQGAVIGSLYVAEREDGVPFSEADGQALERFAVLAAVGIQNARLHRQLADLSVVAERERIAMDLHDGVIQSLFGVRLQLEAVLGGVTRDADVHGRIDAAVSQLGTVMADIRHYVFDLRSEAAEDGDMPRLLDRLLTSMQSGPLFRSELQVEGEPRPVRRAVLWDLWHIAREALTNAVRHSGGDHLAVTLTFGPDSLDLEVADNGAGWDGRPKGQGHHGLENMARRAEAIGGSFTLDTAPRQGARLRVSVPAGLAFADAAEVSSWSG